MGALKHFVAFLQKFCLPVSRMLLYVINFCADYTGRFAEAVKGFMFAVLYGTLFFMAYYSWTLFVQFSLKLGEPLCYLVPVLWIGMYAYAILVLVTALAISEDKHIFD